MTAAEEPAKQQPDNVDLDAMRRQIAEREEHCRNVGREGLHIVCAALARLRITWVVVEYDGADDSGQIESVTCFRDRETVDLKLLPTQQVRIPIARWGGHSEHDLGLLEAIEALVDSLLPAGYEINDGAYGTATIDVAKQKLYVEHNERYTEVETSEFEV